jgi:hypothetical protein
MKLRGNRRKAAFPGLATSLSKRKHLNPRAQKEMKNNTSECCTEIEEHDGFCALARDSVLLKPVCEIVAS